jgi:SanA protein
VVKTIFKIGVLLIVLVLLAIFLCNLWVVNSTKDQVYYDVDKVPPKNIALVLGTSKYFKTGKPNLFFHNRIEAARKLYEEGKVKFFILSGDNSLTYYNEPQDMKKALVKAGIPDSLIQLDYAGFRTFDSVVRSKKVFDQTAVIIITQEFHIFRALFISNYYGMNSVGFVAEKVDLKHSVYTKVREYLARCKAVLDLYILKKEPKYLGQKIKIKI